MSAEGAIDDRDFEAEARSLGWHPQDEYNGDPAKWVDAKTFVTRGEQQLPILRENNRKLVARVRGKDDELAELRTRFEMLQGSVDTLRKMAETANEAGYQRAVAELKKQQRDAVAAGDTQTFDRLQTEIDAAAETHKEVTEAAKPVGPKPQPKGVPGTPEFKAWFEENKGWIASDPGLGREAAKIESEIRSSDELFSEAEIWDKVTEMVQQNFPRRFAKANGQNPPEPSPSHSGSEPRRAASVLSPSGGAPLSRTNKTGIDSIADPAERKAAHTAYQRIKAGIPNYTEAEYMKAYVDPAYDSIAPALDRKAKANGAAVH